MVTGEGDFRFYFLEILDFCGIKAVLPIITWIHVIMGRTALIPQKSKITVQCQFILVRHAVPLSANTY